MEKLKLLYIIGLHVFIVVLFLKPNSIKFLKNKLNGEVPPPYYNAVLATHLLNDHQVPHGAVLFFGDSLTEHLDVPQVIPQGVNFGISKDTTSGLLKRLPLYDSIKRARAIVLAIGVNDLAISKVAVPTVLTNYQVIISQLPSTIPVLHTALEK